MRPLSRSFARSFAALFSALFSALAVSTAALAAPPTTASVEALLAASKSEKMIDSMYDLMQQSMRQPILTALQNQQLNAEQQRILDTMPARLAQVFREELTWAKLKPVYVQIYQDTFTQEEVDAITAFYKTPAGAASIDKMPLVMQKSMTATQGMMAPMIERFKAVAQQVVAEVQAAK